MEQRGRLLAVSVTLVQDVLQKPSITLGESDFEFLNGPVKLSLQVWKMKKKIITT